MAQLRIGTAGWSLPKLLSDSFPPEGTALERYAGRFDAAEINSSFHRPHRDSTWERWATAVPPSFAFSAKLSKQVTHLRKLDVSSDALEAPLREMRLLGERLEVVLVQLPPSLAFDAALVGRFLSQLRELWSGDLAIEPRHASWFAADADALLVRHRAGRVAADPVRAPGGDEPGGWRELAYFRLHGSPVPYRSSYDDGRLERYAEQVARCAAERVWCIFDNTASGAATGDALRLKALLGGG